MRLKDRVDELERRVRELEARPQQIPVYLPVYIQPPAPLPVYVQPQFPWYGQPQWQPSQWQPPYFVTCGDANPGGNGMLWINPAPNAAAPMAPNGAFGTVTIGGNYPLS